MRITCSLVCCAFLLAIQGRAVASPPWQKVALFKQVEANPNKAYVLSDRNGPWVIMAQTFSGDEAEEQAAELVLELRSKNKLRAYRYEMDFDFSKAEMGRRVDQYGQPVKMNYQVKRMHEIAVVVGDFSSPDDPDAQRVLKKLRTLKPDCLDTKKRAEQGKKQYRTLAYFHDQLSSKIQANLKQQPGPMRHAMITTNPLLPEEYFRPKGVDSLVLKMNDGVKYSLLKCPGQYTCKIATLSGQVTVDQKIIEEIEKGKKFESRLEQAAAKAHELTVALRAKGYEAYEFHDRYVSMVTVGSFDAVGTPRQDGQIEINPDLHKLMVTFSAPKQTVAGVAKPKIGDPFVVQTKLGKIACDIQAIPVQVPKRSISRDYDRPALTLQ